MPQYRPRGEFDRGRSGIVNSGDVANAARRFAVRIVVRRPGKVGLVGGCGRNAGLRPGLRPAGRAKLGRAGGILSEAPSPPDRRLIQPMHRRTSGSSGPSRAAPAIKKGMPGTRGRRQPATPKTSRDRPAIFRNFLLCRKEPQLYF